MLFMHPCPTITDSVSFLPQGVLSKSIPQYSICRQVLRQLSNTQTLISRVQNGETMLQHKIKFDQYLKAQIDLLKYFNSVGMMCHFKYNGFFTNKKIDTTLMNVKEQWAFQILITRFIVSSVYIGGAIQSIGMLFNQTKSSYQQAYKNTPLFTKNLQITYKYFLESYDPLRRLSEVVDSVQQLFTPNTIEQYAQANSDIFRIYTAIIETNLVYLKLQKYRVLSEFKSCKEGAWAVYERMKQLKIKIFKFTGKYQILPEITNYINLCIVFYKTYALYFQLIENEHKKSAQQYGFIKKEFQQMINENLVIADEIIKLKDLSTKLPGQELDNVGFAVQILSVMAEHASKFKYRYNIDLHETKIQKPSIDMIISKILAKNVWDNLSTF